MDFSIDWWIGSTGDDATLCARYEIATDTWNAIAPLPEAVNFCKWTTTVVGDKIALVGSEVVIQLILQTESVLLRCRNEYMGIRW